MSINVTQISVRVGSSPPLTLQNSGSGRSCILDWQWHNNNNNNNNSKLILWTDVHPISIEPRMLTFITYTWKKTKNPLDIRNTITQPLDQIIDALCIRLRGSENGNCRILWAKIKLARKTWRLSIDVTNKEHGPET